MVRGEDRKSSARGYRTTYWQGDVQLQAVGLVKSTEAGGAHGGEGICALEGQRGSGLRVKGSGAEIDTYVEGYHLTSDGMERGMRRKLTQYRLGPA
jgi:hypothetical protein